MALNYHPDPGTVLICDFGGFKSPEMVKRRPVIVLSPRLRHRDKLCTIVPLSTTPPRTVCAYHFQLELDPPLPDPYTEPKMWAKADMLYTVSFDRLSMPFDGKDASGRRVQVKRVIGEAELKALTACVLNGLGLQALTNHL